MKNWACTGKHSYGYSWYWWHAPIETQALLIEAFPKSPRIQKQWMTKNLADEKQANQQLANTKATADACYALLLQGTDWLAKNRSADKIRNHCYQQHRTKNEAGTGYFKKH